MGECEAVVDLLYHKSTTNRSNGVRALTVRKYSYKDYRKVSKLLTFYDTAWRCILETIFLVADLFCL